MSWQYSLWRGGQKLDVDTFDKDGIVINTLLKDYGIDKKALPSSRYMEVLISEVPPRPPLHPPADCAVAPAPDRTHTHVEDAPIAEASGTLQAALRRHDDVRAACAPRRPPPRAHAPMLHPALCRRVAGGQGGWGGGAGDGVQRPRVGVLQGARVARVDVGPGEGAPTRADVWSRPPGRGAAVSPGVGQG
eukprot:6607633-Prymnesium_polylepis.1